MFDLVLDTPLSFKYGLYICFKYGIYVCSANQLTGFYMMATLAFNELCQIAVLSNMSEKYFGQ